MPAVTFRVALIPTAKGRHRSRLVQTKGGRSFVQSYSPAATVLAETSFAALAEKHAPPAPFTGPLAVTITFDMPELASWPEWKRTVGPWHHESKPDLDNLGKLVLDALQKSGLWWRDDAQVARLTMAKAYGPRPGTLVTIEQLEQPQRPAKSSARKPTTSAQPALFDDERGSHP